MCSVACARDGNVIHQSVNQRNSPTRFRTSLRHGRPLEIESVAEIPNLDRQMVIGGTGGHRDDRFVRLNGPHCTVADAIHTRFRDGQGYVGNLAVVKWESLGELLHRPAGGSQVLLSEEGQLRPRLGSIRRTRITHSICFSHQSGFIAAGRRANWMRAPVDITKFGRCIERAIGLSLFRASCPCATLPIIDRYCSKVKAGYRQLTGSNPPELQPGYAEGSSSGVSAAEPPLVSQTPSTTSSAPRTRKVDNRSPRNTTPSTIPTTGCRKI